MCKSVQRIADLVDKLQFVTIAKADSPTFVLSLISAYTWQLSIYDCNNFPCIHTLLYIPPYLKIKKFCPQCIFCLKCYEKNQHLFTDKTITILFNSHDAACLWHVNN